MINLNSWPNPNKNTKNVFDSIERQRKKYLTPSQEWFEEEIFLHSCLFVGRSVVSLKFILSTPRNNNNIPTFTASPRDAKSKYKHFLLHSLPCLKCCETNNDLMDSHWDCSHEFSFIAGQIILLSAATKIFFVS